VALPHPAARRGGCGRGGQRCRRLASARPLRLTRPGVVEHAPRREFVVLARQRALRLLEEAPHRPVARRAAADQGAAAGRFGARQHRPHQLPAHTLATPLGVDAEPGLDMPLTLQHEDSPMHQRNDPAAQADMTQQQVVLEVQCIDVAADGVVGDQPGGKAQRAVGARQMLQVRLDPRPVPPDQRDDHDVHAARSSSVAGPMPL